MSITVSNRTLEKDPEETRTLRPRLPPGAAGLERDRRDNIDRRNWDREARFPLIDCNGDVIVQDRRKTPDRRLSNISVLE